MSRSWKPDSIAINASAGYGKTEIHCTRLLATFLGAPETALRGTVALTFTRAAAGEIYSRMLLALGDALKSGGDMGEPVKKFHDLLHTDAFADVTADELGKLLKQLIRSMGELNISTIDSFFYRLVRAYSVELGLPGTVELSEGSGGKAESDRLTRELFGSSGAASGELLAACRESRFGNEEKRCFDSCRELLARTMKFRKYRDDEHFWGGDFARFVPVDAAARKAALEICDRAPWPEKTYRKDLGPLLRACAAADSAEYRFTRGEQQLLREFLSCLDDFPATAPSGYKRGWEYTPENLSALRTLFENGRRVLLCQCARRTAALRTLLDDYLELYDARMLRRGRINFADLPQLLTEDSRCAGEEFLNEMRYRTNSRFMNFLIDEFQDTSRDQWEVLDSISGDNGEGDHSLFIVGDVKQAIYGWREGDSKLMGEVAEHLAQDRLEESYRYGSGICAALNHIFGRSVRELPDGRSPFATVRERWLGIFRDHKPAPKIAVPGEFEVLALTPNVKDFTAAAARIIVARLGELDFFGRGLSGGVLVRAKKNGIALRDALLTIAPELAGSIVWEGDESIAGDPLVASLLAFGVWLQHPADTGAGGVAAMNRLMRDVIPDDAEKKAAWRNLIAERGIHGFLRRVLSRLNARSVSWGEGSADKWLPVENGSTDMLLALAEKFDAEGGNGDFLRFRDLAVEAKIPAAAVAGKLRLLTIHHSKGLTFDVVFHPMFDPWSGIGNWKKPDASGMVVGTDGDGRAWLLNRPREEGMRDPQVAAAVEADHADRCFEELCALYVALTRARFGTYVQLPPRGKKKCELYHPEWKETRGFKGRRSMAEAQASYLISDFLFDACFADEGLFPTDGALPVCRLPQAEEAPEAEPVYYLRRAFGAPGTAEKKAAPHCAPLRVDFRPGERRPGRATPSKLDGERKLHFTLPRADGGELLGTKIHEFFESIGRWSDFTPPPGTDDAILAHYEACKKNAEIGKLLDEECELWRERRFDVVLDAGGTPTLVSGCFDRVQIRREGGAVAHACIIDYKSNQTDADGVPELVEHYREQLETYRRALAALLGITPNLIDCRLVFTRIGVLATV
ncbi:MAG: UvrD-helicase domain-containing protein [Lentisphaeria bacterium]|nr:UvrD-helicase domain-containing protein [Lentisphaeria bacterium]